MNGIFCNVGRYNYTFPDRILSCVDVFGEKWKKLNTELFTDEVEKRLALWNMTSREYSNTISKRRPWEELGITFRKDDDDDDDDDNDKKKVVGVLFHLSVILLCKIHKRAQRPNFTRHNVTDP
jgi:hypothetical protein